MPTTLCPSRLPEPAVPKLREARWALRLIEPKHSAATPNSDKKTKKTQSQTKTTAFPFY